MWALGAGQGLIPLWHLEECLGECTVPAFCISRALYYLLAFLFFLNFRFLRGLDWKGRVFCFPKITAYVLFHANWIPPNFSHHKCAAGRGKKAESLIRYWAIPSAIPLLLSPFSAPIPKFLPFSCLLPTFTFSRSPVRAAGTSRALGQRSESDTATWAPPVGWRMRNIAGYVMCKAESHRSHLVSCSLRQMITRESWFVAPGRQQSSKAYYILIFIFSSQFIYPQGTNLLSS